MSDLQDTKQPAPLLPETLRKRLDALQLVARKIRSGAMKGDRRSVNRGTSIEFADYRNYAPGDDLRRLDWNVYARLERPYIKLLEDEEDLAISIFLDASGSMDWPTEGAPGVHKFRKAQQLTAALGYLALGMGDRLRATAVSESGLHFHGPARGRIQALAWLRYIDAIKPEGRVDLNTALRDFALREKRPGICFIISDLLAPSGFDEGLKALLAKGHEVAVLQVLASDEISPPLAGDLRLIDVETGQAQEVSIDAGLRARYVANLTAWLDDIRDNCARRGIHYVMLPSDTPSEQVLLYDLRRLGLIK